jgi:hypothetical protein
MQLLGWLWLGREEFGQWLLTMQILASRRGEAGRRAGGESLVSAQDLAVRRSCELDLEAPVVT